jgi:hypothetical protein
MSKVINELIAKYGRRRGGHHHVIGHTKSGKPIYGSQIEARVMDKLNDPGMPHAGWWAHSDLLAPTTGMTHEHLKRIADRLCAHGLVNIDSYTAGRPRGIWTVQKRHDIED